MRSLRLSGFSPLLGRHPWAIVSHGQVIEALVHVEDWARHWAVEETFGIEASALNDDRIGRALDAVAPELDGIVGSIGAGAVATFGIDVSRIHWDMTSISLFGAYGETEEDFAEPRFGHPKDRRPDLKQVQTGLGVTADGGVPIFHRAYDGGPARWPRSSRPWRRCVTSPASDGSWSWAIPS